MPAIEQRPKSWAAFAVLFSLAMVRLPSAGADEPPAEKSTDDAPAVVMTDAERAFSERMAGALLTGRFTVDGDNQAPKAESYEIVSATKTSGPDWVIVARVKYGENDVRVPIPVKIHWAGDTPVLSLTDLTIPGLGTFTSRVMFYETRYAGTWQHGEKGGHLFGTIGKAGENGHDEGDQSNEDSSSKELDGFPNAIRKEIEGFYSELKKFPVGERDSREFSDFYTRFKSRQAEFFRGLGQPETGSLDWELRRLVLAFGMVVEAHRRQDFTSEMRKPFVEALEKQLRTVDVALGDSPDAENE